MLEKLNKIDVNKRMIGQNVTVLSKYGNWEGVIEGVKDQDTFLIKDYKTEKTVEVDIFDIRANTNS